jgi:hypothetical protein
MKTISLLLLVLAATLHSSGAPLDDKIRAFNDALKASAPTGGMPFGRMIPIVDPATYPGGDSGLESMVQQMMSSTSSDAVQKAGADLLAAIRADRKAQTDALESKVDAVLSRVPAIVQQAQKPSDLDDILGEIQSPLPTGSPYGGNIDDQTEMNRVNSTYQFVSQWQDYLSESASGNKQTALNTLRNLSEQRPAGPPIVPRSTILARIAALEPQINAAPTTYPQAAPPIESKINPILDSIKTLDDLPAAVQRAQALNTNFSNGTDQFSLQMLQTMATRYAEAKNGLAVSVDFKPTNYGYQSPPPQFARIEGLLLDYLLPLFLGKDAPPLNANESIDDYLDRVTAAATAASNLPLVQKVFVAKVQIAGGQVQEIQEFITALNQEEAGQYEFAVGSYENALRQSSRFTPASFIGDRLAGLQKNHPSEYAAGMKNLAHPVQPNYYPMMNPYARFGWTGYSATSPAPAPPVAPAPTPPATTSTPTPTNPPIASPRKSTSPGKPTTD